VQQRQDGRNSTGNQRFGVVTKMPLRATRQASQETHLLSPVADMRSMTALEMDIVERRIAKRQIAAIGADKAQARIKRAQKGRIVEPNSRDGCLVRVPGAEVIGMIVAAVARDTYIEDRVLRPRRGKRHEGTEHLAALTLGDASRQAVRRGGIVLGINSRAAPVRFFQLAIEFPVLHPRALRSRRR
jgi:hypothetical protein